MEKLIEKENDGGSVQSEERVNPNPYDTYLDIARWKEKMKQEYLITIQWTEKDEKVVVDKLWSVSGRYKVIGRLGSDVCE